MRVLLLNANTNEAMTTHVVEAARRIAPDIVFTGATARFGSRHIGTRATYAIAAHAAIDCYAAQDEQFDAVILACFGDPGLGALNDLANIPVFGLAESTCREAAGHRHPFSIVTGGERWISMLREYLASLGLTEWLASIRVVDASGSEILAQPAEHLEKLKDACRNAASDGASRVILGGAGLIGLAERIASDVPIPVTDCLQPAITMARKTLFERTQPPISPALLNRNGKFIGIGSKLANLLEADCAKSL